MIARPSAAWRAKARTALFGMDAPAPHVVLSPFTTVLDTVAPGPVLVPGWWQRADARGVTILRVPQASACLDAVLCLEPGTSVTFVGACGTLRQDGPTAVGMVVEADCAAAYDGTTGHRTWVTAPMAPTVEVATARSLADSSAGHHRLDADCVDLETAWVLAAAAVAGCPARALLAVTDDNRAGAVFDSDFGMVTEHLRRATQLALLSWPSGAGRHGR